MTDGDIPQAAEPTPPAEEEAIAPEGRSRGIITFLLVVVTCLSIVLTAMAAWAHNTLLDTDAFMEAVGPALEEEALYTALGDRVSTEVLQALDLETRIATALGQLDDFLFDAMVDALGIEDRGQQLLGSFDRPSLEDLAPTVSSGLETRITTRIDDFVQSADFQARVPVLVRAAHERIVALLRGDFAEIPNVSVEDGEVRLNMIPIIGEAIRRVLPDLSGLGPDITLPDKLSDKADEALQQLSTAISARLPEDFGQVTVMSEARLTALQDGVVMLDRAVWALVIFSLILIVVALWVSRTRRRTAIQLAVGIVIGVPITEALLRWVEGQIVGVVTNPAAEETAVGILYDVASGLRQVELLIALAALILGFAVYLSGRPAWAMRVKQWWDQLMEPSPGGSATARWVSAHYDLVRVIGVVAAVVALYIPDLSLLWVVVVGVVLALYLWLASEIRKRAALPEEETVSV
ncbi:MAG TPA: hypothetical protein VI980_05925 [Acidimicrobiia bacterium]|nr:hypothetical protein [Acidimicrobiia bacterium]